MRKKIIKSAKSVNNTLTDDYIEKLSNRELLNFCHPIDRNDFINEMNRDSNDN